MGARAGERFAEPPPEMRRRRQWVCWKYEARQGKKKADKVPICPRTRKNAKTDDPETWDTYEVAVAVAEEHGYQGVGFMFSEEDPFAGVDMDDCLDAQTGEIEPHASEIVQEFDSYTEISPSGTGLKVWIRASKPGPKCRTRIEGREVEVYDSKRFFAYTGRRFRGTGVEERQAELETLYRRLWPGERIDARGNGTEEAGGFEGEDAVLLSMLRHARDGSKFSAVFDGGSLAYHGGDDSRADFWVMLKLAWATGNDAYRMERLFSGSALARRWKWWGREDYRRRTIEAAIETNGPKRYTGKNAENLRERIEEAERWAMGYGWPGSRGGRNRHVYGAMVEIARAHGVVRADGDVVFYAAQRDLMLAAGIGSFEGVAAAIEDLEEAGVVECVSEGEQGKKGGAAATYVLRIAQTLCTYPTVYTTCVRTCAQDLRILGKLRKLRDPAPLVRRERGRDGKRRVTRAVDASRGALRQRINKGNALVLEKIYLAGSGGVHLGDIARWLGKGGRPGQVKHRNVARLVEANLVAEVEENVYAVPDDFEARLDEELRATGCDLAEHIQRGKFDRLEEAHETLDRRPAERAPTLREMRERQDSRPRRRREAIRHAVERLFAERPEYLDRRVGQITCAISMWFLPPDFPRGEEGLPKDAEVEAVLEGLMVAA